MMNNKSKNPFFLFCVLCALFISESKSATFEWEMEEMTLQDLLDARPRHRQRALRDEDMPSPLGPPSSKRSRSDLSPGSASHTFFRASPTLLIVPFSREWGLLEDDPFTKDLLAKAQTFQTFLSDDTILFLMTLGAHYREDVILTEEQEAENSPPTSEQLLVILDCLAQMEKEHPTQSKITSDFVCITLEDCVPTAPFPLQLFYLSLFKDVLAQLDFDEEKATQIIESATLFMLPDHDDEERVITTQIVGNYILSHPKERDNLTWAEGQSWSAREVIPMLNATLFPEDDKGSIDLEEEALIAELSLIFSKEISL
jgi:hypothetical protein